MEAKEFVKKFGLELASRDVGAFSSGFIKREDFIEHYGFDILDDIKTLVDAWEMVKEHCTIERAKEYANSKYTAPEIAEQLKRAIELVESCNV